MTAKILSPALLLSDEQIAQARDIADAQFREMVWRIVEEEMAPRVEAGEVERIEEPDGTVTFVLKRQQ